MQLHKTTSLELNNVELNRNDQARLQCEQARAQEEAGNFEAARHLMAGFWQRVGDAQRWKVWTTTLAPKVLLRAGTITGWIGRRSRFRRSGIAQGF